jgi:hypothetical protein
MLIPFAATETNISASKPSPQPSPGVPGEGVRFLDIRKEETTPLFPSTARGGVGRGLFEVQEEKRQSALAASTGRSGS